MSDRGVRRRSGLGESQRIEQLLVIAPILAHLDPALQVDLDTQQFFNIHAGCRGNLFQHLAAFADNHTLMALALAVDVHIDVNEVLVGALFKARDHHCDAVGNFLFSRTSSATSSFSGISVKASSSK